jgi:competence protein ComGF
MLSLFGDNTDWSLDARMLRILIQYLVSMHVDTVHTIPRLIVEELERSTIRPINVDETENEQVAVTISDMLIMHLALDRYQRIYVQFRTLAAVPVLHTAERRTMNIAICIHTSI